MKSKRFFCNKSGFTFIEIMVTLAILSAGIVAIFRSFFVCFDTINHLTYRLRAVTLLENRIADIEKKYRTYQNFNFSPGSESETLSINNKEVEFRYGTAITPVKEVEGLHLVNVSLSWKERGRNFSLSRVSYFSDLTSLN